MRCRAFLLLRNATIFGFRLAPILLVVYWILLFTGTHLPNLPKIPAPKIENIDKVQHFLGFGGLAFLLAWSIPRGRRGPWRKITLAAVIAVIYAAIDEYTQQFVGRNTDIYDFVANGAGIVTALLFFWIIDYLLFRNASQCPPVRKRAFALRPQSR